MVMQMKMMCRGLCKLFDYLFKEIGLVVEKDLSEFHFFEQSLLNFWANLHRPITSW